jgi:hypothetical protein
LPRITRGSILTALHSSAPHEPPTAVGEQGFEPVKGVKVGVDDFKDRAEDFADEQGGPEGMKDRARDMVGDDDDDDDDGSGDTGMDEDEDEDYDR